MLQVAHFYNTIDQQMIPSQRPMMLGLALAFEQVIKVLHTRNDCFCFLCLDVKY